MEKNYAILNHLIDVEKNDSNYVEIYIQNRDLKLKLHKLQLEILYLYNGSKNTQLIYSEIKSKYKINYDKLVKLEKKALAIGLLLNNSNKNLNDPFVGIEYSFAKKKKQPKPIVVISNPNLFFEKTVKVLKSKKSWPFIFICLFFMFYTYIQIINSFALFKEDVLKAVFMPYWIIVFYPLWFLVMLLHEFFHAIACRVFNVSVEEVGIGRRTLLFVGWVKPNQRNWNSLKYSAKLQTILAGPFLNIFVASIGLFAWLSFENETIKLFMLTIGVIPLITVIPTLIPTNKGDAYLIFTEYFKIEELYSKATRYIFSGKFYKDFIEKKSISYKLFLYGVLSLITRALMQLFFLAVVLQAIYIIFTYLVK